MSLLDIIPAPYRILFLVVSYAVVMGVGTVAGIRYEEGREAAHVIAEQQASLKAMADAAAKTKTLQAKKDEALNDANERAARAEAAASAAHAAGDSLRHDLTDAERVSSASIASLRAYTTTLRAVFAECTAEVERLAGAAQGHASDSLMYQQAWPK